MSILYATVSFEDIDNQNCPDTYVYALCDVFNNMVKKVARMPARTATIHLTDINVIAELKPFILTIEQHSCHGIPLWHGVFSYNTMNLKIIATIQKQK
jgi:hypothetical protein